MPNSSSHTCTDPKYEYTIYCYYHRATRQPKYIISLSIHLPCNRSEPSYFYLLGYPGRRKMLLARSTATTGSPNIAHRGFINFYWTWSPIRRYFRHLQFYSSGRRVVWKWISFWGRFSRVAPESELFQDCRPKYTIIVSWYPDVKQFHFSGSKFNTFLRTFCLDLQIFRNWKWKMMKIFFGERER